MLRSNGTDAQETSLLLVDALSHPFPHFYLVNICLVRHMAELNVSLEANMAVSPVQPNLTFILQGAKRQPVHGFRKPRALYSITAQNGVGVWIPPRLVTDFTDHSTGSASSKSGGGFFGFLEAAGACT